MNRYVLGHKESEVFVRAREDVNPAESTKPHGVSLLNTDRERIKHFAGQDSHKVFVVFDMAADLIKVWNTWSIYNSVDNFELFNCHKI